LLSEQSPLKEVKREREQVKSSSTTHYFSHFALIAKPTPRGDKRARAVQEFTLDLHFSQLCSQSKAHSKTTRESKSRSRAHS
jgi:hypothetical protein